jgi:hypothetical protein
MGLPKKYRRQPSRAQLRREASKTLAYVYEESGLQWTSIREVVPEFAIALDIEDEGRKRADVLLECHKKIIEAGISIPRNYTPPWFRENYWRMRSRL